MRIRDTALSECLQLHSGLTLEKAKRLVMQKEAVKGQYRLLDSIGQDQTTIDTVRKANKTCHCIAWVLEIVVLQTVVAKTQVKGNPARDVAKNMDL